MNNTNQDSQISGGLPDAEQKTLPQVNLSAQRDNFSNQTQLQKAPQSALQNELQVSVVKAGSGAGQITDEMKKTYEVIFDSCGVDAANNWLKQEIIKSHVNVHQDNEALINEVIQKYGDLYAVPVIREAVMAFVDLDLDPAIGLRDQGFLDAMDHMANIYRAGYEAGQSLKVENDSAKARMNSAVNSGVPNYQTNKIFSRHDIKTMSPEDFVKNEKAIFEQLGRGLIK